MSKSRMRCELRCSYKAPSMLCLAMPQEPLDDETRYPRKIQWRIPQGLRCHCLRFSGKGNGKDGSHSQERRAGTAATLCDIELLIRVFSGEKENLP